jgi:hypothetical protein
VPRAQSAYEAVRTAQRRQASRNAERAVAIVSEQNSPDIQIPSNRTFGFEAEFFNIRPEVAVEALRAVGIDVNYERYNHNVTASWKIVTDASVTSRGTGLGHGLELVSPILRGIEGLEMASKSVGALLNAGARVDRTCGLHLHVGMDNLVGAEIMKVIDLYIANQKNINQILANSRHENRFCPSFDPNDRINSRYGSGVIAEYNAIANAFNGAVSEADLNSSRIALRNINRYRAINAHAYSKYGTIEFRQHQGTLNGEKLTSWIQFVLALIEKAVAIEDAKTNFGSLEAMVDEINLPNNVGQFLKTRAVNLASTRS